ncbi:MAG: Crp/Fnr family transcriptional regulator [Bacteroidales bacterium]|nr:Crp/Fnr family transcriptional regulator [Bacteroidales bacterium]
MKLNDNMIRYYGLSESDLNFIMSCFIPLTLKSNEYFLKEGSISDWIGYVKTGVLRTFIYDDDADEVTTQFHPSGSLVISVESFNNRTPSKENIVTVNDSDMLVISYDKMMEVYRVVPVWHQVCKDIADKNNNDLVARSVQFQTLSAAERYRQFCSQNPEVTKYVALRHIASYLGIDIATLSRIRSRK